MINTLTSDDASGFTTDSRNDRTIDLCLRFGFGFEKFNAAKILTVLEKDDRRLIIRETEKTKYRRYISPEKDVQQFVVSYDTRHLMRLQSPVVAKGLRKTREIFISILLTKPGESDRKTLNMNKSIVSHPSSSLRFHRFQGGT